MIFAFYPVLKKLTVLFLMFLHVTSSRVFAHLVELSLLIFEGCLFS